MDEFEIIENIFNQNEIDRDDVILGIGDDAAIVQIPPHLQLTLSIDTLVEGIHFPKDAPADKIGYRVLAVNLSDLAAMGALPCYATLALTLPQNNQQWLRDFAKGFFGLLKHYKMQLIGGNLSHGPLNISCQVHGTIVPGAALTRHGAKASDLIYVTGTLGDAGLALKCLKNDVTLTENLREKIFEKYYCPVPRIEVGLMLRGLANACIDISDGLVADLGHILERSHKGAVIVINQLPMSAPLTQTLKFEQSVGMALHAGDDYELCFTIPCNKEAEMLKKMQELNVPVTCIGKITDSNYMEISDAEGHSLKTSKTGYRHFG